MIYKFNKMLIYKISEKNYKMAQLFVHKKTTEFYLTEVLAFGYHFSYLRLLNIKEKKVPG